MTDEYDIKKLEMMYDTLYDMIKKLEMRIIELELSLDPGVKHIPPDGWYFDH